MAFAVIPLMLPRSAFAALSEAARASIENIVGRELAKAAELVEEDLLPEETAAALSEEMERLAKTADSADTSRVLEALDHISNELNRVAEDAIGAIAEERMALQAVMAVMEGLGANEMGDGGFGETAPPGDLNAAVSALSDFVAAMPLSDETHAALEKALAECGADGMDAESMRKLSELLQNIDAAQAARLANMMDMKSLDPRTLEKLRQACENGGSCTNSSDCSASLAAMLAACEDGDGESCDLAEMLAACNIPGMWGISRGDAPPAPLVWNDPVSKEGAAFKDEALPMSYVPPTDSAQLIGVSASAPEVPDEAVEVRRDGSPHHEGEATGTSATSTVLPRHREAVQRYFTR